jgi:hypothetical protein
VVRARLWSFYVIFEFCFRNEENLTYLLMDGGMLGQSLLLSMSSREWQLPVLCSKHKDRRVDR